MISTDSDAPFRWWPRPTPNFATGRKASVGSKPATLVKVKEAYGPDRVLRYNGYPAAEINGGPGPGFSSGQAESLMAGIASSNHSQGYGFRMD